MGLLAVSAASLLGGMVASDSALGRYTQAVAQAGAAWVPLLPWRRRCKWKEMQPAGATVGHSSCPGRWIKQLLRNVTALQGAVLQKVPSVL